MNLFQRGNVMLHSGAKSRWKIDCDALSVADWTTLALMVEEALPPWRYAIGVGGSGTLFASALASFNSIYAKTWLIADDVLTTGRSMVLRREGLIARHNLDPTDVHGVVVFARGPVPAWVTPLFAMPPTVEDCMNRWLAQAIGAAG